MLKKPLPQPQQQPIKPQTTTQYKKPNRHKPQKTRYTQKNPQQQPNKNRETNSKHFLRFLQIQKDLASIRQKLANQEFSQRHRKTLKAPISRINVILLEAAHKPHE